jgi:putative SOS response-associated peptidase YedK
MCYSAQITADYLRFIREHGAVLSLQDFYELFWRRARETQSLKVPKALEAALAASHDPALNDIHGLIDEYAAAQAVRLEQELFKQRKRLADAQRSLQAKVTQSAAEHERIATDKVAWLLGKLSDLKRTTLTDEDARLFPGWMAPVMVMEGGRRVVKPMRYQCRPAGKPASHDRQFPGTYNARRDNLEGFWKGQFGRTHGLLVVNAFYENVARDGANVVLEFRPRPRQDMLVACLWSRWSAPGEPDLLSFAAITDAPPEEIAAAGHDRCIIPIRAEHIDAWLTPQASDLRRQYEILDDRERPYFENRLAA